MTDAAALPGQPRGGVLSGPATARAVNVLAPNASVMTLDGTNTWIVSEPDSDLAVVIDPGPLDDVHLRGVVHTAERAGKRVALTLLTHGHPDHAEGAARFAELTRTNVRALDPPLRLGDEGLGAGDVISVGGLELRCRAHPRAHRRLALLPPPGRPAPFLTGRHGPRRGTTVVAHPDGRLGEYLDSLRRLRSSRSTTECTPSCPATAPSWTDAQGAVEFYLAHRAHRLAQVETAVENGHRTPARSSPTSYADVDPLPVAGRGTLACGHNWST
ncbi:MBL fold metallo-hydrolase [Streptomyces stelliscabiei]